MSLWLNLALFFAALELFAVSKNLQGLEYIAKPAVMLFLFLWLHLTNGSRGVTFWFEWGILFSLVGDVLLISSERMFLMGLIAFLLTHITYLTGFFEADLTITVWSLILAVIITMSISRLLRSIVGAMQMRGEKGL